MLTELYEALALHLAPLDAPVYLAECVPPDTLFPYVTAQVAAPCTPAEKGRITLTLWCLGSAANSDRLHLGDALLSLLPAEGLHMPMKSGFALLRMDSPAECLRSGDALGLRMTWSLRCYPHA